VGHTRSGLVRALTLLLLAGKAGHAQQSPLPDRAGITARAGDVTKAVVGTGRAIVEGDPDRLLSYLRHDDVVVRFGVHYLACRLGIEPEMRRYAELDFDRRTHELRPTESEEMPRLKRRIKSHLEARPRPWVAKSEQWKFLDKGYLVDILLLQLTTCNNTHQFPFFGGQSEQVKISLLGLELAKHARGTKQYRSAATQAVGVFACGEQMRQLRNATVGGLPVGTPDDAIDRLLDWHWETAKFTYFHPFGRYFKMDSEAFEAGMPSWEYRQKHPWGKDEGPNLMKPEWLASAPWYNARVGDGTSVRPRNGQLGKDATSTRSRYRIVGGVVGIVLLTVVLVALRVRRAFAKGSRGQGEQT